MIYSPGWGSHYATILPKYVSQTIKTLRILFRNKPKTVFVMTPPVFACLPVWIYALLTGSAFVIDAHSGAFLDSRWKGLLFLHRFFSRRAQATILTNEYLQEKVRGWGGRTMLVRDVPVYFAEPASVRLSGAHKMVYVSGSLRDEPLELFLRAARRTPEIQFYLTGSTKSFEPWIYAARPANVHFTDFLPDAEYVGTLLAADAVIALTIMDHTMQRGAYEAAYLGKPIITSDFDVLNRAFSKGTVHVKNTEEDLVRGFREMTANLQKYQKEVLKLREDKLAQWAATEAGLRALLHQVNAQP